MSERKYFGTDGIRGHVGEFPITPEFMLKLGWAAGQAFKRDGQRNSVLIGKDTRLSGYMFESALEAGLAAAGVDVKLLGPMPTPAIAYLTRTFRASAGIVISASHNPHHDNGIKFFSAAGTKLDDALEAEIERWLDKGLTRVILGTAALRDPDLVRNACREYPGRVAVGIDARNGRVAVEGWAETSDTEALDLAQSFEDAGVAAIIYTDIQRDGAMQGPNVAATATLARHITTPVIASGGVSCHADLEALKAVESAGIEGVICGRALYDGRIEAETALALLAA